MSVSPCPAAATMAAELGEPESQQRPGSALPAASTSAFRRPGRPMSAPAHRQYQSGPSATTAIWHTTIGGKHWAQYPFDAQPRGGGGGAAPAAAAPAAAADDCAAISAAERAAVFRQEIKRKLEERGKGDREAFHFFDRDKDGKVNQDEFKRALEGLNLGGAARILPSTPSTTSETYSMPSFIHLLI